MGFATKNKIENCYYCCVKSVILSGMSYSVRVGYAPSFILYTVSMVV